MIKHGKTVLTAMSGGVDSAVSAILLRDQGFRVTGLYIDMLGSSPVGAAAKRSAMDLASRLKIDLIIADARNVFDERVIKYFKREYMKARTPNPCVICNPEVKFRIGLDTVKRHGIDLFATGHYARINHDGVTDSCILLKGVDPVKDQSYFLHRLKKKALSRSVFPIGGFLKKEVQRIAKINGITSAVQPESQEICFLDTDYKSFLEGHARAQYNPGEICTVDGKVKGSHKGLYRYTVGQRRGLGIPDSTPYYVIRLDAASNTVIIGKEGDLLQAGLIIEDVSWIAGNPPDEDEVYEVKIRYRHKGARAVIKNMDDKQWQISFETPQRAITPGQYAVIYHGDCVLGGGRICA